MDIIHAPEGHPAQEKIRVKGSAKQFKAGPKPSGRERLQTRAMKLCIDVQRFAAKRTTSDADRAWAEQAAADLQQLWGTR